MKSVNNNLIPPVLTIYFVMLAIALYSQDIFRFGLVFNIGTNWRIIDIFLLGLLFAIVLQNIVLHGTIFQSKFHLPLLFKGILFLYFIFILMSIYRGYPNAGTWAIGMGRYSILGIALIPIILHLFYTKLRIMQFLKFILITLLPIMIIQLTLNYEEFLSGFSGQPTRGLGAPTIFGIASISIYCISYLLFNKEYIPQKKRIYTITIFVFAVLLVFITQRRSAWVAMAAGIVSIVFFELSLKQYKQSFKTILGITSVGLFVILIISISYSDFIDMIVTKRLAFLTGIENDPTGSWRLYGWINAIRHTLDAEPVFGFGFDDTRLYFTPLVDVGGFAHMHNEYVHLFQVAGYTGAITFISLLLYSIIFGIKHVRSMNDAFLKSMLIGSVCALIMSSVFMLFYLQTIFIWIFIPMIFLLPRLDKNDWNLTFNHSLTI
jgi:hypothetical protein